MLVKGLETNDEEKPQLDFRRPYFDQFYDILSGQNDINPLTMSFCIKIFLNILKFDNDVVMKSVIEKPDCIDVLLGHIDSNAIIHFFTEFVQCEDSAICSRKQVRFDLIGDRYFCGTRVPFMLLEGLESYASCNHGLLPFYLPIISCFLLLSLVHLVLTLIEILLNFRFSYYINY